MNSKQHLIKQQCRTCYESTQNLQFLTSYPEEDSCPSQQQQTPKTYAQLLTEVCNINPIEEDLPADQWPQFICLLCSEKLKSAYDFIQQTHKVNKLLKSFVKDSKIENHTDLFEKPELDISLDIKQEQVIENNERLFLHSPMEGIKSEIIVPTDGDENSQNHNNLNLNVCKDHITQQNTVNIPESNEPFEQTNTLYTINSNNSNGPNLNGTNISKTPTTKGNSCHECHKVFPKVSQLKRHLYFVHERPKRQYCCPQCDFKHRSTFMLKKHLRKVHNICNFQVELGYKITVFSKDCSELKNTEKTMELNNNVEADIKDKETKENRKKLKIKNDKELCPQCGLIFKRFKHFVKHMRYDHSIDVMAKATKFRCDKCTYSTIRRCRLKKHEIEKHSDIIHT